MQLRHIRPRSVEWYDAVEQSPMRSVDSLSPEETLRLRTLVALESGEADPQKESLRGLDGLQILGNS